MKHAQTFDTFHPLSAHDIEGIAQRRVKAKLGWVRHAAVYAAVIVGLTLIGLWQGRAWPLAPALGWGLGLAIHGFAAFRPRFGETLKANMLRAERARLAHRQTQEMP
ncbi:MAG: 2TM domain-containing protein [Hydrogenophaga sp.]